ncbi:MAG: ABC transporter permease, partial [bacterium]
HMHFEIAPLVMLISPANLEVIAVKIRPADVGGALAFLEKKWQEYHPNHPFRYEFLDQRFDRQYIIEGIVRQIFRYAALLAIFIACLGLFGLASYAAERRTKEIGIRKVLGASVSGIVMLLTKKFTKWLLVANIIAWPIAYLFMSGWLKFYAYRIDIGWWVFALAGGLALMIALLTVSTQAIRAALANPVESLRYE